jgi:hypothetical protein
MACAYEPNSTGVAALSDARHADKHTGLVVA